MKNQEQKRLEKELFSLIPKLDEEGLAFLVEQAQIHLYNMQVDVLNETLIKFQKKASQKISGKGTAKTVSSGRSGGTRRSTSIDSFNEIKASESGASYYIVYNAEWIMFSKSEMLKLKTIACGAGSKLEIKERLFNWFARERKDLLLSAGIASKFDDKLLALAGLLKKYSGIHPPGNGNRRG